ncbi:MAG: hypothetical protein WD342_05000 [Verrucomicrobiales bacterium]
MKIQASIIAFSVTVSAVFADLPPEAEELLSKLSNWELDQQVELQQRVATKRAEVSKVLNHIVSERTKAGDLDGALAIREKLEALTPPAPESKEPIPASKKESDEFDADKLVGTEWENGGKRVLFATDRHIKVTWSEGTKATQYNYQVTGPWEVTFTIHGTGENEIISVSKDYGEIEMTGGPKLKRVKTAANIAE